VGDILASLSLGSGNLNWVLWKKHVLNDWDDMIAQVDHSDSMQTSLGF
jgi:hypothetical protein